MMEFARFQEGFHRRSELHIVPFAPMLPAHLGPVLFPFGAAVHDTLVGGFPVGLRIELFVLFWVGRLSKRPLWLLADGRLELSEFRGTLHLEKLKVILGGLKLDRHRENFLAFLALIALPGHETHVRIHLHTEAV